MAEELLLEAEFESASNPLYGFSHIIAPAPFVLEIGAEYRAVFDGVEYPCTGLDASPLGTGAVGIGNGAAFGLPGSGEPFCFGTFGGAAIVVCLLDAEPTQHSIAIYGPAPKESGVILESYDGSQNVFPGVETVSLYNTEGGTETFVHDSLVAEPVEATVDVDWSGGDMEIVPDAGQVFSKILLPKPETAIPENILDGVNLAGIIGGLVTGGGNAKIAVGTFAGNTSTYKITTNHGFKPDFIFAASTASSSTSDRPYVLAGFSSALIAATGTTIKNVRVQRTSTMLWLDDSKVGIDESSGNINSADATGFKSKYAFVPNTWAYIIIGGLT